MKFLVLPFSYKLSFPHIAHVCLNIGAKRFIFGKNFILHCELDTSNSIVLQKNNVGILPERLNVMQSISIWDMVISSLKSLHATMFTFGTCKMENNGWLVKTLFGMIGRSSRIVVLAFAKVVPRGTLIIATFLISSLSLSRITFKNANIFLNFISSLLLSILDVSDNNVQFHITRVSNISCSV